MDYAAIISAALKAFQSAQKSGALSGLFGGGGGGQQQSNPGAKAPDFMSQWLAPVGSAALAQAGQQSQSSLFQKRQA